ncbi:MAG: thiamine-phosphate kinase [Bacteroidales bacterium]|nr:thiamine-phosphate kinase [Bacteroidales bacterium]
MSLTPISNIGEFSLIEKIAKEIKIYNQEKLVKGIGDDAAVIEPDRDKVEVITSDMLVENIHFDLSWMPLKHLGYKSVAVNLSDVVAMNAIPEHITVTLAMSNRFTVEAVDELYEGMRLACEKYKIDIIGGDMVTSNQGLIISITALGSVEKNNVLYRSGANVNDLICVSGDLGTAYAGLLILQREKRTFMANPHYQPDLAAYEYAIEKQIKPEPRLDIINKLKELNIQPTAMIDISDGLSSELHHICKQSHTGCRIYEDRIPIDIIVSNIGDEFNISPITMALNGGEDYELLFTIPLDKYDLVKNDNDISVIGHITDESDGLYLINNIGEAIELKAQGWDSFNHNI